MTTPYNYPRFKAEYYDLSSFDGPGIGEPFPDVDLTATDGQPIHISQFRGRRIVLETGSVTCPMYARCVPAMLDLTRRHPDVEFLVIYVREAHPAGRIPPHILTADKQQLAGRLRTDVGDPRAVLIDDVDGTLHKALGSLPNMVYVIGSDGTIEFRGDWNNPNALAAILDNTATDSHRHRAHYPPTKPSPSTAISTLLRGGRGALWDMAVGLPKLIRLHKKADQSYRKTP